jgi:hypothetical protein
MILENLEVLHKAFGKGVIVATNGKYITVKFETASKTFVYPDIFEKFLTLADGSVSDEIIADLNSTKAAKQKELDKKNEENLRAMTRGIVIPGKENLSPDSDEEEGRNRSSDNEEV